MTGQGRDSERETVWCGMPVDHGPHAYCDGLPPAPSPVEGETERCGVPCDEGSRPSWWAPCDREQGHDGPHTWPLDPPPLPASSAVGETRVEWGVRFDWTGSNVQQWGRTWDDEFEARLSLDQYLNDPEVTAAWLVTRTVTTSAWVPVTDKETDRG